jgi:peptide/nickel transport system substrate-binding protein
MKAVYSIGLALLLTVICLVGAAPAQAKDTLVIDLVNEPTTLDPHKQWNPSSYYIYRNIFDNMLTRTPEGKIVPQVAESWKYLGDTEVEFKLRKDIKFHDGTPLTADDVVYSVKRITDPKFKSPQRGQFNTITKAEAVDKYTVKLTTKVPYPVLQAQLVKLSIVPKAYVSKVGAEAFNKKPVGSGPYKFQEWKKGVSVTLAANGSYWRSKPPFAKVVFRAVPEAATRVADLRSGKADLVVSLNSDLAAQLKGDSKAKVLSVATERVAYFRLNSQAGPTKDIKVRKAIAHAINRQLIIDALKGGYAKPTDVMVSETAFGFTKDVPSYPYDLAKAKALVKEAGLGDKELLIDTAPVFDQRVVQAIQQMLIEAGINAKIVTKDMATFLKGMQAKPKEGQITSFGRWSCACQDVDGIMFPMLHGKSIWSNTRIPELDAALEAGRSSLDPKERMKNYMKVHKIVYEQVPLIPLYQVGIIYGAAKQLQWKPTANESMFIMDMSWK